MANPTSTLSQTQPEKKTARNLALGLMEDTFEILTGQADSGFVNEGPGNISMEQIQKMPEHQAGSGLTIGGKNELRFDQPSEATQSMEARAVIEQYRQLPQEITTQAMTRSTKEALARQREKVNSTIGIGNVSYVDTVNESGEMRVDVEVYFTEKNSEMDAAKLKKQRGFQVEQATGKINYFMQHNMAGERQGGQHVLNAAG